MDRHQDCTHVERVGVCLFRVSCFVFRAAPSLLQVRPVWVHPGRGVLCLRLPARPAPLHLLLPLLPKRMRTCQRRNHRHTRQRPAPSAQWERARWFAARAMRTPEGADSWACTRRRPPRPRPECGSDTRTLPGWLLLLRPADAAASVHPCSPCFPCSRGFAVCWDGVRVKHQVPLDACAAAGGRGAWQSAGQPIERARRQGRPVVGLSRLPTQRDGTRRFNVWRVVFCSSFILFFVALLRAQRTSGFRFQGRRPSCPVLPSNLAARAKACRGSE